MGKRMDKEREEKLQPLRVKYAKEELLKLGFDLSFEDETTIKFDFKGNTITFFPYSGWFSGKGIKDGRGINKLLKRLNYKPMKKMYLQKMTDFVLNEKIQDTADKDAAEIYQSYARFLQKPLKFEMFLPSDEYGNILEQPLNYDVWEKMHLTGGSTKGFKIHEEYLKAKEKVFFKTKFEIDEQFKEYLKEKFETIEELANVHQFELTDSAITEIGL